jgi:hypothetical protein
MMADECQDRAGVPARTGLWRWNVKVLRQSDRANEKGGLAGRPSRNFLSCDPSDQRE